MYYSTYFFSFLFILITTVTQAQRQDPFASTYKETVVEKEEMIKYPKFDAFLQAKLDFSVPIISIQEFKELQESGTSIVLLDTRSEIAYNISHIPSSKRVGYDDFSIERVWTIPRDANIVVYCTLGYKSEQIGNFLTEMGFKNVQNLYGSIVEWVNEGGIVINENNKRTKKVVVKDKEKRHFLKKGHAIILSEKEANLL